MKFKRQKKSKKMRGHRTHGHSAKLNKGKGSRGGKGMSGSGKRADQKKTKILKENKNYFGKRGFKSRKKTNKKIKIINLQEIQEKYPEGEINLKNYKILGNGEIKKKFAIKAKAASKSAIDKIKKAGGEIILDTEKKKIENKKDKNKSEKIQEKGKKKTTEVKEEETRKENKK